MKEMCTLHFKNREPDLRLRGPLGSRTLAYLIEIQLAHPLHIVDASPKRHVNDRRFGDKNGKDQQDRSIWQTRATDDTKWQISVSPTSRWANRFIVAAIVQGALAAGVTSYLLYDAVYGSPGPARIVAGGSAGTWLTVGYLGYIMLGPLAAAITALFYQHLEVNLRAPYKAGRTFSPGFIWF